MKYFIVFIAVMNIITFSAFGIDKLKAKKDKWRIRERTLFLPVLLGGGVGASWA